MAPTAGPSRGFATGPAGPGAGDPGPGGTGPGDPGPGDPGPGDPGADHQMVAPGGAIVWLSCGVGPVPARPSGADSGGGAGREPTAIRAVAARAAVAVAGRAAGGAPWDQGPAGDPAGAESATATGFFSHQRCSTGIGVRTGVAACRSRVISRLWLGTQSGSQHSCSRRTSSSTCGSPIAASCFQASVSNGGKKSFLANSRFLEL